MRLPSSCFYVRFYVGGRAGVDQLVGNGTAGFAELRRDVSHTTQACHSQSQSEGKSRGCGQGFASVGPDAGAATAVLRTKPILFDGKGLEPLLFINAEGADHITIAINDAETGKPLPGLGFADYVGGKRGVVDSERLEVLWASHVGPDKTPLFAAQGKRITLEVRFASPAARLYSFWFASDHCGASRGWVAAGGAGFNASRDLVGSC